MGRVKDYAMDEAEQIISDTISALHDGQIYDADIKNIFEENKDILEFIGIEDLTDFMEGIYD